MDKTKLVDVNKLREQVANLYDLGDNVDVVADKADDMNAVLETLGQLGQEQDNLVELITTKDEELTKTKKANVTLMQSQLKSKLGEKKPEKSEQEKVHDSLENALSNFSMYD